MRPDRGGISRYIKTNMLTSKKIKLKTVQYVVKELIKSVNAITTILTSFNDNNANVDSTLKSIYRIIS